jgi:hypothetical protein
MVLALKRRVFIMGGFFPPPATHTYIPNPEPVKSPYGMGYNPLEGKKLRYLIGAENPEEALKRGRD